MGQSDENYYKRLLEAQEKRNAELAERVKELEAIVNKLPKTADGVPRLAQADGPDDTVFAFVVLQKGNGETDGPRLCEGRVMSLESDADLVNVQAEFTNGNGWWGYLPVSKCYSTREAALTATKKGSDAYPAGGEEAEDA